MAGRDLSAELFGNAQPSANGRDLSADLGLSAQPPAAPLSRAERFGRGLYDPIAAGAQLLTNILPEGIVNAGNRLNNLIAEKTGLVAPIPEGGINQLTRQDEQAYQARRAAGGETGLDAYRLAGNVINPANLAIGARLPQAASLAGRVGTGILGGAISGGLTPVGEGDFSTEKLKQIGGGAAVGGALPVVTGAISRVISPLASQNANLQLLRQEGVTPTVGQALGGRLNAAEEKLQSIPIIGDAIANARKRSLESFNQAAINRATGKIGQEQTGIGQEGIRKAGDAISDAYDSALNSITGVRLDQSFNNDLLQLRGLAQGLTSDLKNKFNGVVNEVLLRKVSRNGSILPNDYKAIDSELGNLVGRYSKSQVASEQEFGDAVKQLQSLLNQQMARSNPQVAGKLQAADEAYANLVRLEGAAKAAKNNEGVFTPAQLNQAVQIADNSVRKRSVARGTALLQDLSNAGQSVIGNKVPNSFTTDRALLAGGSLGAYALNPAIPAGLLGGAALYTSPIQRALVGSVASRPQGAQQISDLLRGITPLALGGSGQLGIGLLNSIGQ
jgi:hypothetical protein